MELPRERLLLASDPTTSRTHRDRKDQRPGTLAADSSGSASCPERFEWNCVVWVRQALLALQNDGKAVGTSVLDWHTVRDAAMKYCQEKIDAHRFDGKVKFDMTRPATYDFLKKKKK